jgi:hypothetical protein
MTLGIGNYQANTLAKSGGEREQDIYCWVQPTPQPFISTAVSFKLLNKVSEHGENGKGGISGL